MLYILLCSLVLLLTFFLFKLNRRLLKEDDFHKIHGPEGFFFLGNTLFLLKDGVALFESMRETVQKFKKLFKARLGHYKVVVIYSPENVEALVTDMAHNQKGFMYQYLQPWLKDGLLLSYGKKWQHRRKLLTPAFHFNVLRHFSAIIVRKCDTFVKKLERETHKVQTDLLPVVADFTLDTICETAMGTSLEELNESGDNYKNAIYQLAGNLYKRFTNIWLYFDVIFKYTDLFRRQRKLLHLIFSFRNKVVESRKQNPYIILNDITMGADYDFGTTGKNVAMLDILLKAESEGKIDTDGVSEEVDTFMFEGHDTTATALQFTLMLLANHKDVEDKIAAELDSIYGSTVRAPSMSDLSEMKYLECCIKESLRLYPPVYFMTRNVEQPLKLDNSVSIAGCEVFVSIYDLHRCADQFVEPLKFMPERFMTEPTWHRYAYIPFSAGPRNCIGQKFAMMELKLAISSVLRKYRLLPVTKPEEMVFISELILRTKDPVYVKFEKRYKS